MLTMIQVHLIRHLLFKKGLSYRKIAEDTGHDFRTVKKYIEKNDWNKGVTDQRGRPSKVDPVKDIIDEWLKDDLKNPPKQRHTAKRIYERLLQEHTGLYQGSDRTIRDYVSKRKKELLHHDSEGYLPLTHPPGEAQADFGQAQFYEKGQQITGYYLTLSFPYSNASLVQVFKGQNQECLLTGLKSIFERIGSVPRCIWFDNLSAAVVSIKDHGKRQLTEQFERFSLHYGFEHNFCNPNSGHEKGHVENKVGYNRRNFFVPVPSFVSILDYNQRIFAMAENDQKRPHYQKGLSIESLFRQEVKQMLPLPSKPFEVVRWKKAKASNYGKIRFDSNIYSASPQSANSELWVKASAHEVQILDEDYKEIIKHERLYGKNKEAMNWYPYLTVLSKRPNALKYTDFYREMPEPWQEYFAQCDYQGKKAGLQALIKIITETDMDTATNALQECLKSEVVNSDSILLHYYRLTQPVIDELTVASHIPELDYKTDIRLYDDLLSRGQPA